MSSTNRLYFLLIGWLGISIAATFMSSCSDEPATSNYYTFKGQMMSEYLISHENYSQFTTLVQRTGMMKLLSTYGEYTCFVPTNQAMDNYLSKKGLSNIDQLSLADCDTLVRTHLVKDMYTTAGI